MGAIQNKVDAIMTAEEAVQLANEIERVEAAAKIMKDKLKKFVEANGPVETSDKVWDLSEAVSYKFDSEQLKMVAQNIALEGKNPWDYLGITASNLNKLGWSEDFLQTIGKRSISTRFSSRKK